MIRKKTNKQNMSLGAVRAHGERSFQQQTIYSVYISMVWY